MSRGSLGSGTSSSGNLGGGLAIRGSLPLAPLSALVDRFEDSFESELRLRSWRESHLSSDRSSVRRSSALEVDGRVGEEEEEKKAGRIEIPTFAQWSVFQQRTFAVARVPDTDIALGYPTTHQAYYLSTGTSNAENFPGVFFPCMGAQEVESDASPVGWIMKMTNFGSAKSDLRIGSKPNP